MNRLDGSSLILESGVPDIVDRLKRELEAIGGKEAVEEVEEDEPETSFDESSWKPFV